MGNWHRCEECKQVDCVCPPDTDDKAELISALFSALDSYVDAKLENLADRDSYMGGWANPDKHRYKAEAILKKLLIEKKPQ